MNIRTIGLLFTTHLVVGVVGFGAGIYALPILTAPPAPDEATIEAMSAKAQYVTHFRKDLKGSDRLHQGEGTVSINSEFITFIGKISPGPDYMLYLSPEFVETKTEFNQLKHKMVAVGEVKTFSNFIVSVPENIDPSKFNTVIVWCESFEQFITAAKYQ